jgi:hypothetical protein
MCNGARAVDGHEKLPRARGGSPHDPENVIHVCRACHDAIGDYRFEAVRRGLLIQRKEQP